MTLVPAYESHWIIAAQAAANSRAKQVQYVSQGELMRKPLRKLTLKQETVRKLADADLARVPAGLWPKTVTCPLCYEPPVD
jgi:hypothetical protein